MAPWVEKMQLRSHISRWPSEMWQSADEQSSPVLLCPPVEFWAHKTDHRLRCLFLQQKRCLLLRHDRCLLLRQDRCLPLRQHRCLLLRQDRCLLVNRALPCLTILHLSCLNSRHLSCLNSRHQHQRSSLSISIQNQQSSYHGGCDSSLHDMMIVDSEC